MSTKVDFEKASENSEDARHKIKYVTRAGLTAKEVSDIYKSWANSYDNVSTVLLFVVSGAYRCFLQYLGM